MIRWRGVIALQGWETGDHRILEAITWRALPLTLRIQTEDFGGHSGASPVGRIDELRVRPAADVIADGFEVPEDSDPLWGEGAFSDSTEGALAAQWVDEQVLRGVSVDPGALEYVEELVDPATGEVVEMERIYETWDAIDEADARGDTEEEGRLYEWLESLYFRVRFTAYEVAAATLVATPAFGHAVIEIWDDEGTADTAEPEQRAAASTLSTAERLSALLQKPSPAEALVAAFGPGRMIAAGAARRFDPRALPEAQPPAPTAEAVAAAADDGEEGRRQAAAAVRRTAGFYLPQELTARTPFSIDPETLQCSGHLFGWNDCHRSFAGRCERPEREQDFSNYHTGSTPLDDGTVIRTGVLTFHALHAPHAPGATPAMLAELMENTGTQFGTLRLYADEFGVQACGQAHPDVDAEMVNRVMAGYPSGDWRKVAGRWSLYGLHVVNTPGYPAYEELDGQPIRMVASLAPFSSHTVEEHSDCGCGGSEGACGCGTAHGLSPARIADLAHLDAAMAARRALAPA